MSTQWWIERSFDTAQDCEAERSGDVRRAKERLQAWRDRKALQGQPSAQDSGKPIPVELIIEIQHAGALCIAALGRSQQARLLAEQDKRGYPMGISLIEQVKIQAQVLVPLVRTLQAELGEERANALVRKSLGALYRQFGEAWWRTQGASTFDEKLGRAFERFAAGDALDYEVLEQTTDTFELNVTGCRYAKFYQELGAPELGFLLTCSADFSFAEGFGSDVQLTRTQTIMQGASHCDFRYKLRQKNEE